MTGAVRARPPQANPQAKRRRCWDTTSLEMYTGKPTYWQRRCASWAIETGPARGATIAERRSSSATLSTADRGSCAPCALCAR